MVTFRRYYPKSTKQFFVLNNEQFNKMVEIEGLQMAMAKDNAFYDIKFESVEEMNKIFHQSCENVINNTRWYLDNLDIIPEFKVKYIDICYKNKNFIN